MSVFGFFIVFCLTTVLGGGFTVYASKLMANVKEFRDWLCSFPDDAIVSVLTQRVNKRGRVLTEFTTFELPADLDISDVHEFMDFTESSYIQSTYLNLGRLCHG